MASMVDSRVFGNSKSKQQEFKDFLEDSGIVKCITAAFTTLFDSRPRTEDGLVAFQKLVTKSFDIKLEGEEKRSKELLNQIELITKEKLDLIKQVEKLEIEIKQMKEDKRKQNHETQTIQKQLLEIRKDLRSVNPSSTYPEIDVEIELSSDDLHTFSADSDSISRSSLPSLNIDSLPDDMPEKEKVVMDCTSEPRVVEDKKENKPAPAGNVLDELKASGGIAALKKTSPPAGNVLDEIKTSGGIAVLKKTSPPTGNVLDEIKTSGGIAALKKSSPPAGNVLDEIKTSGGIAALKKTSAPTGNYLDELKASGGSSLLKTTSPSGSEPKKENSSFLNDRFSLDSQSEEPRLKTNVAKMEPSSLLKKVPPIPRRGSLDGNKSPRSISSRLKNPPPIPIKTVEK